MIYKPKWKGTPIYNPNHPRILKDGGYVEPRKNMTKRQIKNDSILAVLQPNEIVIPVKYKGIPLAKKVKKYLIKNKIILPNF